MNTTSRFMKNMSVVGLIFVMALYFPLKANTNGSFSTSSSNAIHFINVAANQVLTIIQGETQTEQNNCNAINLDGQGDYVSVPHNDVFDFTDQLTLEAWVYYKGTKSNDHDRIISKTNPSFTWRTGWAICRNFIFSITTSDTPSKGHQPENARFDLNVWTHIAVTYDGSQVIMFKNGAEVYRGAQIGLVDNNTYPVTIGSQAFYSRDFWGILDEVRVWNISRSNTEIGNNMFTTLNGNELGLVGYWKFDEEGGNIAHDSSPYVNNGTLIGDAHFIQSTSPICSGSSIQLVLGTENAVANDTIMIPLNVEFPTGATYSSAEISFGGFQGQLEFIEVVTDSSLIGEANWNLEVNDNDTLLLTASAGAKEIGGSGVLFWLKFAVPATANDGFIPITIESALFNTGNIPVNLTSDGVEILSQIAYGDVDLNGMIQAYDASLILKYLVGYISLTSQQLLNSNVSTDTTVSSLDASLILSYVVGLVDSLPYFGSYDMLIANGDIEMNDDYISQGHAVEIPLQLLNVNNILSFHGEISYNPSHLNLTKIDWSPLLENFTIITNDSIAGIIRFSGASAKPQGDNGMFGTLKFMVNDAFNEDSTVVSLKKLRWNEGEEKQNVAQATLHQRTGIAELTGKTPKEFQLQQNYPNPFNPSTTIAYEVPQISKVILKIYNVLGKKVVTLVNRNQPAGFYKVEWDGENAAGVMVNSGLYIYQITAGDFVAIRKMTLIR